MKTIRQITNSKAFQVGVSILVMILLSISIIYAEERFRGSIEQAYFPVNDEHGIYAETKINMELDIYKNWFVFIEPTLVLAHGVRKPDREEKRITSYGTGFGYIKQFDAGVGVKINEQWEVAFLYRADRTPDQHKVGDFGGVKAKWSWGK